MKLPETLCAREERQLSGRRDFWLSSGHHLLDRSSTGWLTVSDEFLKAYFARPELVPPEEACSVERALHRALLNDPRQPVEAARVAAIADADARENWELMLAWRDHLVRHDTLEAAYLDIVAGALEFPPLFINQLVQIILRNVLDECADAYVLRAAELFFRPQKLTQQDGALLCADEETVAGLGGRTASPLISLLGLPAAAEIDVLNVDNAATYWERSDAFDLALQLGGDMRGLVALGEVIQGWIRHLLAVEVTVVPIAELREVTLNWYLGLDVEATRIGDAVWAGESLDEATQARLVGLFKLSFADAAAVEERLAGAPTYLIMAMTKERTLRLKPQNLVSGLPLRQRATA
jgi:hypothetical protein